VIRRREWRSRGRGLAPGEEYSGRTSLGVFRVLDYTFQRPPGVTSLPSKVVSAVVPERAAQRPGAGSAARGFVPVWRNVSRTPGKLKVTRD